MSVAESTVIFGPMFQVGCASASAGVTSASSLRLRPRKGPPEAVRTSEWIVSSARPSRHWNAAECSLSTGRIRPPPRSLAASASGPAATRLSLFAKREVDTALERLQRRREACESHDGVQYDVWLARPDELVERRVAADRHVLDAVLACDPLRFVRLRVRRRSAHSSSSAWAATTSSACVPIEPVAPSRATRFMQPV